MSNRKNPSTSHAAYRSVHEEMKNSHYSKIIKALQGLGSGIYTEIADYAGMEKNQVSRRLLEMEGLQLVWKPGAQKPTKAGRKAFVYQLTGNFPKTEASVPKELQPMPQNTTKEAQGLDNGKNQGSFMFDF